MPRLPKPPELRQRRNKSSTRATLPAEGSGRGPKVPKLPARGRGRGAWHARVRAWWTAVWKSPMATQFLDADRQRLEMIAELHQRFWVAAERGDPLTKLAAEIRQEERDFGLTPMDRRRLEWEIKRVEKEDAKPNKPAKRPKRVADPRKVLRAVK